MNHGKEFRFYAYKKIISFTHSIRSRKDIIELILNLITKEYLSDSQHKQDISIIFYMAKMVRVFIYERLDKIHSFNIPFLIKGTHDGFGFFNKQNILITAEIVSFLKTVFHQVDIANPKLYSNIEHIFDILNEYNIKEELFDSYFGLIIDLLSFEPGYLRYDHDVDNIKINHPEYHIDFNYSQNGTFKLGLNKMLSEYDFINLVDIQSCKIFFINN
ncbi:MAG: hypothetical protein ACTTJ4_05260 [Treponema sp.]|uniref:hypothetical protein n=1 Tax=Treponema sp. TaxID=166 RepID=UPI003FA1E05E